MEEKVVHMVLKVDLECHRCYKKVRKILYKIPQVRDQVYDEKEGTVSIKVVSCTPEKIMNKICSKGDKSINSIHIKEPERKNEEKEVDKKKIPKIYELVFVEEPKKGDPKVGGQPDHGNRSPPPHSVSGSPMYEGRPSYQYQDYGIPVAPPSYDSYGGEYDQREGLWRYYVGQSSNNYNQRN